MLCFLPLIGFPGGSDGKESAYSVKDLGLIPVLGRFPREGQGYPLQYSYLESSMDKRDWQVIVHGVVKSQTQLSDEHFHFFSLSSDLYRLLNAHGSPV